jgi:hypothetical protein
MIIKKNWLYEQPKENETLVKHAPTVFKTYPGKGYCYSGDYQGYISTEDYLILQGLNPHEWPKKNCPGQGHFYNHEIEGYLPEGETGRTLGIVPSPKTVLDPNAQAEIERLMVELKTDFKGNIFEEVLNYPKTLYLQRDGFWGVYDCEAFRLVAKDSNLKLSGTTFVPGQYQVLQPSFKLKTPLIDGKLFSQVLALFRYYVNQGHQGVTEVMVQFYWDSNAKEYFIECPRQVVSGGHIEYCKHEYSQTAADCKCCKALGEPKPEEFHNPRIEQDGVIKVLDIHSHNTMSAFFSGVDDADEKGTQFYGVIGNISPTEYKDSFRMGVNGQHDKIERKYIIDESTIDETLGFPEEWLAKVHLQSAAPITILGGNGAWDSEDYYNNSQNQGLLNDWRRQYTNRGGSYPAQQPQYWLEHYMDLAFKEVHDEKDLRAMLNTLLKDQKWRRQIIRHIKSQHI